MTNARSALYMEREEEGREAIWGPQQRALRMCMVPDGGEREGEGGRERERERGKSWKMLLSCSCYDDAAQAERKETVCAHMFHSTHTLCSAHIVHSTTAFTFWYMCVCLFVTRGRSFDLPFPPLSPPPKASDRMTQFST